MRRWVCIIALLAGFTADGYVRSTRLPTIVPIERQVTEPHPGLRPTPAWWGTSS
jgi:hypothetical protein